MYAKKNKRFEEHTAVPSKYPQGYFKPKLCRECSSLFEPTAPSRHYCSQKCADRGCTTAYLKRTYGITLSDYEWMIEEQEGRCAICGGEGFIMNKNIHRIKLVVDHCHETGKVRGLLCHNCNRALGLLQDDMKTIKRAVGYLEGATTIPKGSTLKRVEAHGPCMQGDDIV